MYTTRSGIAFYMIKFLTRPNRRLIIKQTILIIDNYKDYDKLFWK